MESVSPQKRITKDLEVTEEVIFTAIALNPDSSAEEIRESYNLSPQKMSDVLDTLFEKELVEQVDKGDVKWRVKEIGRLMLLKYVSSLRFDLMEARLREQSRKDIEDLKRKKKFMEQAYKQSKVMWE